MGENNNNIKKDTLQNFFIFFSKKVLTWYFIYDILVLSREKERE